MTRNDVWRWLVRDLAKIEEGRILPIWALVVRAVLFPLDFLRWRLGVQCGYQFERDVFVVSGCILDGQVLRMMVEPNGRAWRVLSKSNGVVIVEDVTPLLGVDSGCNVNSRDGDRS